MLYRIGDVSKHLNISDQMIRYYEKCGVIHPVRSGDGRYRYYSEMDIFLLFEAMKYKEWDINIADIGGMIADDYYDKLISNLEAFTGKLNDEISYKQILKERTETVRHRLKISRYNTDNVWVDTVPAHYLYSLGTSARDTYEIAQFDQRMAEIVYSSRYISFFDPYVEYEGDSGIWWYMIPQKYHDLLHVPDYGEYRFEEEKLMLMSVIDMGEPGEFNASRYTHLIEYAKTHHYEVTGKVQGILVGRGIQDNQFVRMMQIMVPVRTL
ncbi:MAG: MerR family transcriptional regulator [Solobacterium sp.]|nr:MerR family transcriptional regulator [Solobacterium sp.]